jgi:hypothetical protein
MTKRLTTKARMRTRKFSSRMYCKQARKVDVKKEKLEEGFKKQGSREEGKKAGKQAGVMNACVKGGEEGGCSSGRKDRLRKACYQSDAGHTANAGPHIT